LRSAIESIAAKRQGAVDLTADGGAPGEIQSVVGDRLVIIDPENPVWIGSPGGEPGRDPQKESLVPVNLSGAFAISTREVTVEQFLRFAPEHGYAKDYAETTDCPIINVSWFDAARYCRWLSKLEGIPEAEMCYPKEDEIRPGMTLEAGFEKRIGYRLPTEAEWELACRGGVAARRWFGFDPKLLADHAWTSQNSEYRLKPVGCLLPNDFGLFDMLGNAMEWCHCARNDYPTYLTQPMTDPGLSTLQIDERTLMMNRGGANLYQPLDARSSQRNFHSAESSRVYITFRIARTIDARN
jgi:formylglycine-generating enzyme required for sulfatase activity